MWKVVTTEEIKRSTESVIFENGSVRHAGGGRKGNQGLSYHLYLNPKDVELKDAAAFVYGDSMEREMWNKHEAALGDVYALYLSD